MRDEAAEGPSGGATRDALHRRRSHGPNDIGGRRDFGALACALLLACGTMLPAYAGSLLPTGGSVTSGSAAISQSGATLNISQSTNQAIINWQSFSVGRDSTVNFNQPSAASATLNRVTGATPSWIAGTITAPGTVLLVNPNGIAITKSGVINTGSFAASTLNIKDQDFLAGRYTFGGNGASAGVRNAGRINASDGGFVALLGGQVSNSGVISAKLGKVGLGSGEMATLDLSGDGFLSVAVPSAQLGNIRDGAGRALVANKGKINAAGGTVYLSAATAANVLRDAVNVPGSINARSVGTHNGRIVIGGGPGGIVRVSGRLAANGGKNRSGGRIDITGDSIKLAGARVNASGGTGGGTIRIGGDQLGGGTLPHAQSVSIDSATVIRADALERGNGGNITLLSDGLTSVHGVLSARGGRLGGDGGIVETSGHSVDFAGVRVDTSAANGRAGLWLVDPTDLTIDSAAAATISSNLTTTNVTLQTNADGTTSGPGTTSSGPGDIIVNASISWNSAHSLSLNAFNGIKINAPVSLSAGSLNLNATTGSVAINNLISVTGAGNVAITAQPMAGVSTTGLVFGNGGAIDYGSTDHGGTFSLNGANYTLVYSMAQLDAIDGKSAVDLSSVATFGPGLAGNYALATNFDASGTVYTSGLITTGGTTGNPTPPTTFTGKLDGLGHSISNLTITSHVNDAGLIGSLGAGGVVSNIGLVNVSLTTTFAIVPAAEAYAGLVAFNSGTVQTSYATGSVLGVGNVGLLVGTNNSSGTVQASYAFGTVNGSKAGALVGSNAGTVQNTYAGGLVTGAIAGGLVGINTGTGTVKNGYSTTDVAGGAVGSNSGTVTDVYWDSRTSGTSGGLTTNQLQGVDQISGALFSTTTNLGDTNGTVWGGGANGLYPFLKSFYPNGAQAVSGIVHKEDGSLFTPDRSLGTAPVVYGVANGRSLGSAMTGANGYYYIVAPAGSIANGAGVLTYLQTNATVGTKDALRVAAAPASGTVNTVTGLDIWNGAFTVATNATLFSAGPQSAADARAANASLLALAEGGNTGVTSFVNGVTGLALITSGASFTFDTPAVASGNLIVSGAPITVDAAITLNGANTLSLLSTGPLPINAPITVTGAGTVIFSSSAIADISTTGLTFGTGASLDYGSIDQGGKLFLNGNSYLLLYTLSGGIPSGGSGFIGLATDAAGGAPTAELSNFNNFDGLGHTISLTGALINQIDSLASVSNVRLALSGSGVLAVENIGIVQTSSGSGTTAAAAPLVIDNNGIVQGSHSDAAVNTNSGSAGGLVAENQGLGTVRNSYATGAVFNASPFEVEGGTGGLVGTNTGLISGSYATGAVNGAFAVGGLVGLNDGLSVSNGVVQNSYATGAVYARGVTNNVETDDWVGGLVGANFSLAGTSISNSYSTGAVSGNPIGLGIGGLLGFNRTNAVVTNSYWDMQTSGQQTSAAGTGLTTTRLQNNGLPAGFDSSVWAGATGGIYPYLKIFFPNGVQVVSGIAYTDAGINGLAGGRVNLSVNGTPFGGSSTGANGYYYLLLAPGTIASGNPIVAYTDGPAGGATLQQSATAALNVLNIYGSYLKEQAAPATTTLSALSGSLATALGGTTLPSYANREIDITAASFTIDQAINAGTLVLTAAGATVTQPQPIIVSNLLVSGSGSFSLTNASNNVGTLAALIGTSDTIVLDNGGHALSIGSVNGVSGVSAGANSLIGTAEFIDVGGMTQSQPIEARNLLLMGSGTFDLSTNNNSVDNLAANLGSSGTLLFNNGGSSNSLSISAVGSVSGITAGTVVLSNFASVTESNPITATNLLLNSPNSSFSSLTAANSVSNFAANLGGDLSFFNNTALTIGTVNGVAGVTLTGAFSLNTAGDVTQSAAAAISTTTLTVARIGAADPNVALDNANNTVGNLGAVTLGQGAFTLRNSGDLAITGAGSAGGYTVSTPGDLTIASTATVTAGTNKDVVLAAAGNFINNRGSDAIAVSGSGRWLVYSNAPGGDTFANLDSKNTAIWNAALATLPPASVNATGNRYLFANQPTVTFKSTDVSKFYGDNAAGAVAAAYTVSGLQSGVAGAFLGDTLAPALRAARLR